MTENRAIELLRIEKTCILRAKTCDRDCGKCDLVQEDKDLLSAYDAAIEALEHATREKNGIIISGTVDEINTVLHEINPDYPRQNLESAGTVCYYNFGEVWVTLHVKETET